MRATQGSGWRSWGVGVGLSIVGGVGLGPAAAAGQTRFRWPTDTVDLARYTVEECLAALVRRGRTWQDQIKAPEGPRVHPDTMPFAPLMWQTPLPPRMIAAAEQCAAKFVEPKTPLEEWRLLMPLYLAANRDRDAATLVERRLAATAPGAAAERSAIIDTAIALYTGHVSRSVFDLAQPRRYEAAAALLERQARQLTDRGEQFQMSMRIRGVMLEQGDSAGIRATAERILALVKTLTDAEFLRLSRGRPRDDPMIKVFLYNLQQEARGGVADREGLDSLRKGTASYVAFKQQAWQAAVGTALPLPIGERAPKLEGEVWVPQAAASQARPTPGKISLILFLDHPSPMHIAVVHRLLERFPALEITLVTRGYGYFRSVGLTSPAAEAAYIQNEWAKAFYAVPVTLVMTPIPKYQLPAPDGRWLRKPGYVDPNYAHYTFGNTWQVGWSGSAFLVDQQGRIVYASNADRGASGALLGRRDEAEVAELIDILLHRPVATLNAH